MCCVISFGICKILYFDVSKVNVCFNKRDIWINIV